MADVSTAAHETSHSDIPAPDALLRSSVQQRAEFADRYATALIGNLSRGQGPDDDFIDAVDAVYGDAGLETFLVYGALPAKRLAAFLVVHHRLDETIDPLSRYVKHANVRIPELVSAAWNMILHGDDDQGFASLVQIVSESIDAVEHFVTARMVGATTKRRAKGLLTELHGLRDQLNEVL